MKIEGVVISCYKADLCLTRLCVASVRLWYPNVAIWLLKDRHYGDFDTREIERRWGVRVYPSESRTLGWGFGKLEVMTEPPARRLLLIDSDIVFAGPVINRLEQFDEDIVVAETPFADAEIQEQFFDVRKLAELDPEFHFPGWGFNGGQILATTGRISKRDMDGLVDWHSRNVTYPEIFKMGDQGLTNFAVQRKLQRGEITVRRDPFMVWPGKPDNVAHIRLEDLTPGGQHRELIHWAGLRWGRRLAQMPRSDILLHFEDLYYSRVPGARAKRLWRAAAPRLRRVLLDAPRNAARSAVMKMPSTRRGRAAVIAR